jgi:D-hexose-6-phosphate mutarotase
MTLQPAHGFLRNWQWEILKITHNTSSLMTWGTTATPNTLHRYRRKIIVAKTQSYFYLGIELTERLCFATMLKLKRKREWGGSWFHPQLQSQIKNSSPP